jgi:hypothetical protein
VTVDGDETIDNIDRWSYVSTTKQEMSAMPFEPGNQAAVGFGRPRRIDVELARLEEAAEHARRCLESQQIEVLLLEGADPEIAAIRQRRLEQGLAELVALEARLEPLRHLAEEVGEAVAQGRRRRRRGRDQVAVMEGALNAKVTPELRAVIHGNVQGVRLHGDPWSALVSSTAAALDRLVGEEAPQ